jgi:hypothetical protein
MTDGGVAGEAKAVIEEAATWTDDRFLGWVVFEVQRTSPRRHITSLDPCPRLGTRFGNDVTVAGERTIFEYRAVPRDGKMLYDAIERRSKRVANEVARIQLPDPAYVARVLDGSLDHIHEGVFEARLHPDPVTGKALDEAAYSRFAAFLDRCGGEAVDQYRRLLGSMTSVPIRLDPDRREELVKFNHLRVLIPTARVELRAV